MRLNDGLEIFIFSASPVIIAVGILFAGYIWGRHVSQGKNGIYKAIMYTSLFFGLEWGLTMEFYLLDGAGLYGSNNLWGVGVRLYRALLAVYCLLIITMWYKALTKEE